MKQFLASAGSALILASVILPTTSQAAASHAAMSIRVASSTLPRQVSMKQLSHLNVSMTVKSTGVSLQGWLLSTAAPTFSFRLLPAFLHGKAGRHKLIFALARNNNVLYKMQTTSVSFTVK